MNIKFEIEDVHIETKSKMVKTKAAEPIIFKKDAAGGDVERRLVSVETGRPIATTYIFLNEYGLPVDKDAVKYFDENGEEVSVHKRMNELVINEVAPSVYIGEFLIEKQNYLVPLAKESPRGLYKIAKYLWDRDLVGISYFSWGGAKAYLTFVVPRFRGGQFALEVFMTRSEKVIQWLEVPDEEEVEAPKIMEDQLEKLKAKIKGVKN